MDGCDLLTRDKDYLLSVETALPLRVVVQKGAGGKQTRNSQSELYSFVHHFTFKPLSKLSPLLFAIMQL